MTPNYGTMLTAVGQVFASAGLAYVDAAARFADCSFLMGRLLATNAADVIRALPEQRQAALENAVSTVYHDYVEVARVAGGLPNLSVLVFLNALDRMRGPRMSRTQDISI